MASFQALYGRKCRSSLHWSEVGDRLVLRTDIHQEAEDMILAQSRQNSYAYKCWRYLEFHVGDHVFLNVSPTRGAKRFSIRGKLSPRFIGPFEILERIDFLYHQTYQVYTMCFMFRCSRCMCSTDLTWWNLPYLSYARIWALKSIWCEFWLERSGSSGITRYPTSWCFGKPRRARGYIGAWERAAGMLSSSYSTRNLR